MTFAPFSQEGRGAGLARAGYPQDFAEFIEPPGVEYLPKPFALTALLEKVRLLPPREHTDNEKDAPQGASRLLTQSLEDLRLAERIERALGATGYGPLRVVVVSVSARIVHLAGRVP
jgi:hypothetical protein